MSVKLSRMETTVSRELSYILENATNEYIKAMTITGLDLSSHKEVAKIYYMTNKDKEETEKELEKAMSYIKRELSNKISFRKLPELKFIYDDSYDYGKRIDDKLKELGD